MIPKSLIPFISTTQPDPEADLEAYHTLVRDIFPDWPVVTTIEAGSVVVTARKMVRLENGRHVVVRVQRRFS